jgi:5-oxoprolinase (ATP-hydrolysing)
MPSTEARPGWQFWIDRGGTFTDVVARSPDGRLHTHKLLSEAPERYADAAVAGIEAVLDRAGETLAGAAVDAVKMGTTVATNALLERKGEPAVLAITAGFADALEIGYQSRPRLFDRHIVKPAPLHGLAVEVDERLAADGTPRRALDVERARADLAAAFAQGYRAIAIVLMHGYRHPAHERRLAALAREVGFTQVSVGHEVSALVKLVGRGDTTVADAYLSPILRRYVAQVAAALPPATRLLFMQSSGGLTEAGRFRGCDAILSGPAGGIVGMARTAVEAGFDRVLGFDMGGTSTDVCHYAGAFERTTETTVAGVRIRAPMMDIHTVAAGGGSICGFDGARLRVGPASAGARPGPACYRHGGPLTITDCNVMLGKVRPEFFPRVFGPRGDEPLDAEVVARRFAALAEEVEAATGRRYAPAALAEGFVQIAVEHMAKAVKQISIARGHDVARYALASFGGAGGQHACLVADALGVSRVMIHPLAGVLSAYGMGCADLTVLREATVEARLTPAALPGLEAAAADLEAAARAALEAQGVPFRRLAIRRTARLKYEGTDTALSAPFGDAAAMAAAFEALHLARFGFVAPEMAVTVEALSVEAIGEAGEDAAPIPAAPAGRAPRRAATVEAHLGGRDRQVPVYRRGALAAGTRIAGPAIVAEDTATTVVEPGWTARVDARGNLILERTAPPARRTAAGTEVDPVRLEVFNSLFMAAAEQMGVALQSTAYSVNIKERLDFSCALFDAEGALVANAPHIPVHLGSMGDSVRAIMTARAGDGRGLRPGDVYMLNAPYSGGTHLPDVTVVTPVFADGGARPAFYVAARGHHADIGGVTPGSMPPRSRRIEEEGVLIDDVLLVEAGRFREAEVRALLAAGPYPARNPDQNVGDLKAQVAACAKGAEELGRLVAEYGLATVVAYMGHVQANAEEAVRRVLARLRGGAFALEMDDGAVIRVRIEVDAGGRSAVVDFAGTSPQQDGNLNAPPSICRAAVLYVLRTLVDDEIPLNDGCLRPVRLEIPEGSMLNPRWPAAVVAGNVETSQAVVDALYGALGVMAAAQGTMNNFTFGDARRQYYETICGGSGAGPDFDGASAVQTHMTNSRLTDPEVLETRFPVLVDSFSVRRGSGGPGRRRGGDGVVRAIRFLEPMTAAILSNRRRVAPFGLDGGGAGAVGRNRIERADGGTEMVGGTAEARMAAEDVFVIETPGGGGYGAVGPRSRRSLSGTG